MNRTFSILLRNVIIGCIDGYEATIYNIKVESCGFYAILFESFHYILEMKIHSGTIVTTTFFLKPFEIHTICH